MTTASSMGLSAVEYIQTWHGEEEDMWQNMKLIKAKGVSACENVLWQR